MSIRDYSHYEGYQQQKRLASSMNSPSNSSNMNQSHHFNFAHAEPSVPQKPPKIVQVFVESNIEFNIEIKDDPTFTCGWLQSEVVRKYYEVLEKQAYDQ